MPPDISSEKSLPMVFILFVYKIELSAMLQNIDKTHTPK